MVFRAEGGSVLIITKTVNENEATIAVKGWLDTQAAPLLQEELDKLEPEITGIILDFSELEYISSSGVREVVAAYKKVNGNLVVRKSPENVMNVFRATGISRKIRFE